jgi:peptidyl-prolyl cis-trans isomerase C
MKHTLIQTIPDERKAAPFSGCGVGPTMRARREAAAPPVSVNGVAIPETAIAQEAQNHPASSAAAARAAAARALAIRELLLQRARALGLTGEPLRDADGREEAPEEALIRAVLEKEIASTAPSEDECRRVFEARAGRQQPAAAFERALPIIREALRSRAWASAAVRYVDALARAARIDGLSLSLRRGPPP